MNTAASTFPFKEITSLADSDKAALIKDHRKQIKTSRKSVVLDKDNDHTYKLVLGRSQPGKTRSFEDSVKGLGLAEAANKKLIRGMKQGTTKGTT